MTDVDNDIAEKFKKYLDSYLKNYTETDETEFIQDMIYGLGESVSDDYKYKFGFEKFKTRLYRMFASHALEPCPNCGQVDKLDQFYWPGCKCDFFSISCDRDECEDYYDEHNMDMVHESDYDIGVSRAMTEWNQWAKNQKSQS